jgi:hypothetical protein
MTGRETVMTKTKRALTATAVTAAATAIALVPATAQARHMQPRDLETTTVMGHADYTQLSTHDQVLVGARGVADGGFGAFGIQNDDGTARGRITCVTGSTATDGVNDAAIGVHITRSTIAGLPSGTDAIEYVRDGGGNQSDASGLVTGTATCPESGFTVPSGVLVTVPDQPGDNNPGEDRWQRYSRYPRADDGFDRGRDGFRVQIQH